MQSSQILEILTTITYSHVDVSCSELTRVRTAQQSVTFVISIWSIFLIYILTNSYIIKNYYILMITVMKVGIEALKEMIEVDNIFEVPKDAESEDDWALTPDMFTGTTMSSCVIHLLLIILYI